MVASLNSSGVLVGLNTNFVLGMDACQWAEQAKTMLHGRYGLLFLGCSEKAPGSPWSLHQLTAFVSVINLKSSYHTHFFFSFLTYPYIFHA